VAVRLIRRGAFTRRPDPTTPLAPARPVARATEQGRRCGSAQGAAVWNGFAPFRSLSPGGLPRAATARGWRGAPYSLIRVFLGSFYMPRVALFLDFENFYTTLKRRTVGRRGPFGASPHLDFEQLVAYIEENYGELAPQDFIVVANFTHYNPQIGGLNRVATVIDAQSFQSRQARQHRFGHGKGKKFVIRNYADMRLAFEVGRHVATRPADIYMLGSGDEAFTAIGRTLREMGFPVVFLVADPDSPSVDFNIRAEFDLLDFAVTQREPEPEPEPAPDESASLEQGETLVTLLGDLRRELSTAIPVALLEAILGPAEAQEALRKAQGRGQIDLWESPSGVPCVSLQSERLFGKVQVMESRADVVAAARLLAAVHRIAQDAPPQADRPYWRRALRQTLGLSNRQAKQLLQLLLQVGVLADGRMTRPRVTMEALRALLSQADFGVKP